MNQSGGYIRGAGQATAPVLGAFCQGPIAEQQIKRQAEVRPASPIESELNRMSDELARLEGLCGALVSRLESVRCDAVMHYTTHGGRLHHFQVWPGLEEQVGDDFSHFVATGVQAFDDGDVLAVTRHKPGVVCVMLRHGNQCRTVYSRDEFLPPGVRCFEP